MRTIKYIIILGFCVWWGINFFFNLPETSLPILLNHNSSKVFKKYLHQRWGFFAPPPDFNNRLYYEYQNLNDSLNVITYEVFEQLNKKKNERYLFNDDLINLDYILHNVSTPIGTTLYEYFEIYKSRKKCSSENNDQDCYRKFLKDIHKDMHQLPQLNALLNHAKIIARKENFNNHKVRILVGATDIAKFADRYKKNITTEKKYHFLSDYYNIKLESWEK